MTEIDRAHLRKILRQARWADRRDRLARNLHRPICWVVGHDWIKKMDLHGGAICHRCPAFRPAVRRG